MNNIAQVGLHVLQEFDIDPELCFIYYRSLILTLSCVLYITGV